MSMTDNFHTAEDEWLVSYCAGGLSPAKRMLLSCQAAVNPGLNDRLAAVEAVGGALLEDAQGAAISDGFMSRMLAQAEQGGSSDVTPVDTIDAETSASETSTPGGDEAWMPAPLTDWMARTGVSARWKNMGFGAARMQLFKDGDESLYLLKVKPGLKMPHHSHYGEEWALILQGGYHVGEAGYVRGDLHREDETCAHQPIVDNHGEACITLVASEGGLKFTNPILRLLKPIFKI